MQTAAIIRMPIRKPRTRRSRMAALEPGELLRVLKVARDRSARDWSMILVAYCHGLRASEVCNLERDALDLKTGAIRIERLKGSLPTTQALCPHKGNPLL